MKKFFSIFVAVLVCTASVYAFPLKVLKQGDKIDMKRFHYAAGAYKDTENKAPLKVLLLWRGDKRLSVKIFNEFKELCANTKAVCVSVELDDKAAVSPTEGNVIYAVDSDNVTAAWGIFTLPVTLVLDKDNKVLDGFPFEGQYKVKMNKFISDKSTK